MTNFHVIRGAWCWWNSSHRLLKNKSFIRCFVRWETMPIIRSIIRSKNTRKLQQSCCMYSSICCYINHLLSLYSLPSQWPWKHFRYGWIRSTHWKVAVVAHSPHQGRGDDPPSKVLFYSIDLQVWLHQFLPIAKQTFIILLLLLFPDLLVWLLSNNSISLPWWKLHVNLRLHTRIHSLLTLLLPTSFLDLWRRWSTASRTQWECANHLIRRSNQQRTCEQSKWSSWIN